MHHKYLNLKGEYLMDFIKKIWKKYKDWLGDTVWYKNWKVWLTITILIVLGFIGETQNRKEEQHLAEERIEMEQIAEQDALKEEKLEQDRKEEEIILNAEKEKEEEKKKEEKKLEREQDEQEQKEEDKKIKEALDEWRKEYPDIILNIKVFDLIVDVMMANNFDLLLDSEKQEVIMTIGSNVNEIAKIEGKEEDVDVIFYNTSENEIGSYRKTMLGEYKTKLK